MTTIRFKFLLSFFFLVFLLQKNEISFAQSFPIDGTYKFMMDDDGRRAAQAANIQLTFNVGEVFLRAEMPGNISEGPGRYSITNNLLSVNFDEYYFTCSNQPYTLIGGILTLPFAILGGENATSSNWLLVMKADGTPVDEGDSGTSADSGQSPGNGDQSQGSGSDQRTDDQRQQEHQQQHERDSRQAMSENFNDYPSEHYAGRWYGSGWGWEVRFKHTAGDFVSQFTGVEKGSLPFENEKVIMSLIVQHGVSFFIDVDDKGRITGEGTIVYDLIPNLCAVAALTHSVNQAINMMEKTASLFQLSGKVAKAAVQDISYSFMGLNGDLAKAAKIGHEIFGSKPKDYLDNMVIENIEKLYLNHRSRDILCQCVAGIPVQGAGTSVGPQTLDELISEFGVGVAKSMFGNLGTISSPAGMMLQVPGVTQIQYNYKGLVGRPQTRNFSIKGFIENGMMFLETGKIEGDNRLWVEYTVNYKTERSAFPVWSPFLSDKGIIKPAGNLTVYEPTIVEIEATYINNSNSKENIVIENETMKPSELHFEKPFASFNQFGRQRNNVSVWHEYEYNWFVYKFEE